MNTTKSIKPQTLALNYCRKLKMITPVMALFCFVAICQGQGTTTFTFEGQPSGTLTQVGPYYEGGRQFRAIPFGALYLSGGGVTGFPDNGTGYLVMPDGNSGGMRFESTNTFPTSAPFNLVSFDAGEFAGAGPATLTVIGYKPMAGTVTNIFTLDGINDGTGPAQDFQTFYLDSNFVNLFRIDVLPGHWSLDNLVISGVPEPSSGALVLLGTLCGLGWSRVRNKRT